MDIQNIIDNLGESPIDDILREQGISPYSYIRALRTYVAEADDSVIATMSAEALIEDIYVLIGYFDSFVDSDDEMRDWLNVTERIISDIRRRFDRLRMDDIRRTAGVSR